MHILNADANIINILYQFRRYIKTPNNYPLTKNPDNFKNSNQIIEM